MEQGYGSLETARPHLPPEEFWIFRPGIDERRPTPLNGRQLVDIEGLMLDITTTLDPSYDWSSDELHDLHHLYFWHDYPDKWRNLALNKIILPRKIHNWYHQIYEPPPVPPQKSRDYREETQEVVLTLFSTGKPSERMQRVEKYDAALLKKLQDSQLAQFVLRLEAARAFQEEFRVIDLSDPNPETVHDMYTISKRLGKLAINRQPIYEPWFQVALAA